MNDLITIKNVRGYVDENGTAFLNLEDVARGLGFVDRSKGTEKIRWARIRKYLEEFKSATSGAEDFIQNNSIIHTNVENEFIPENIFYKLCMKANNETARRFQDLVCDEILPAIRRDGGYIVANENDNETTILARAVLVADKAIKRLNKKIDILEKENKNLLEENKIQKQMISDFEPIKDYLENILGCFDVMCISQIAADYGMTGHALNKILNKKGLIRKVNNQWILCAKYLNRGYTASQTKPYMTIIGYNKIKIDTCWTQKGRLKIHEILTSMGIKANMDKEKCDC